MLLDYPEATDQLNLTGIISIESDLDFDTIFIGHPKEDKCLGYVGKVGDQFRFVPLEGKDRFPDRNSYEECLFDLFVLLANDPDYAQEFAVLAMRKVLDSPYEVQ